MSETIGAAILTKTLIGHCDGQCGGEVQITTDEVFAAYAETIAHDSPYTNGESDLIAKRPDGAIVVACGAVNVEADLTCTGEATFTKADLNAAVWTSPADAARWMIRMERV